MAEISLSSIGQGALDAVTDCAAARFRCGVCLLSGCRQPLLPGGPGCAPAPTVPGWFSFRFRRARCCWSGGCGQGAEPLPASQDCFLPWPVRADLEDALAGVVYEAGREVPDSVAERVQLGFLQVGAVVGVQQSVPGGEVSGDIGGEDPAAVDLPSRGRQVPQAHRLRRADAICLDDGVLAVDHVDVPGVVAPGNARYPASGMFVQVIEYFQPVFFS
jgi:hypothetical protein